MNGLRILSPVQYRRFYSGLAVRRGSAAERGSLWAGVDAERFHRRQDRAAASVQPLPLAQPQEPLVDHRHARRRAWVTAAKKEQERAEKEAALAEKEQERMRSARLAEYLRTLGSIPRPCQQGGLMAIAAVLSCSAVLSIFACRPLVSIAPDR